jgi:hypothetical protein
MKRFGLQICSGLKNFSDFSSLTVHDMFYDIHIASIRYGICTAKSIDITTMMLPNSSDYNQIIESESAVDAYHNSIIQVLTGSEILNNQDQTQTILQEINNCVHTELQSNRFKSCFVNLSALVKHETVQTVYIDGHNSIVKNLPIPTVGICNRAAYIPARETTNHLWAIGIDVMFSIQCIKKTGLTNQVIMQQSSSVIFIKMFQP